MVSDDFRGLVLYNSLTDRRELFRPRTEGQVKIFTCGPSIYRRPHIGNFRTFVYEDILVRYLEYLGYSVTRVLNFTDLEDKTIATAAEEGTSVSSLTSSVEDILFREADELGMKMPDSIPRSSTSIDSAVALIEKLVENGHAYWHEGNVYFDPLTYPRFGEIFGLDMSRWPEKKVRFSRDTYNGLRWNRGDFILWHGWDGDDWVHWDTPIGKGRPAWNIQDPAMIAQTLGYEIDIHCGGIDNMWRHHDYNRAVLESVSGSELAHYWLHGEHLIVEGEKMSKSKGNVLYVEHLIERGCSGQRVRFMLAYGYYRDKMNITEERLDARCRQIEEMQLKIAQLPLTKEARGSGTRAAKIADEIEPLFRSGMNDDLNVKKAIDGLYGAVEELAEIDARDGIALPVRRKIEQSIRAVDTVLGVLIPRE